MKGWIFIKFAVGLDWVEFCALYEGMCFACAKCHALYEGIRKKSIVIHNDGCGFEVSHGISTHLDV